MPFSSEEIYYLLSMLWFYDQQTLKVSQGHNC